MASNWSETQWTETQRIRDQSTVKSPIWFSDWDWRKSERALLKI